MDPDERQNLDLNHKDKNHKLDHDHQLLFIPLKLLVGKSGYHNVLEGFGHKHKSSGMETGRPAPCNQEASGEHREGAPCMANLEMPWRTENSYAKRTECCLHR